MSYLAYWNLDENPFLEPRPGESFSSGAFEEARARLHYLINRGDRLAMLMGPSGTGKTVLLREMKCHYQRQHETVALLNTIGLHGREFLELLLVSLSGMIRDNMTTAAIWRDVFDLMRVNIFQQTRTVFLVDNVDRAAEEILEPLLRIIHWPTSGPCTPTVIVSARDTQPGIWAAPFVDQCPLRVDLEPWDLQDTAAYLTESMQRVGRTSVIFEMRAIEKLHELSGGAPRRVVKLAEMSLLAGAAEQLERVDAETVESVEAELSLHIATAAQPMVARARPEFAATFGSPSVFS